MEGPRSIWKSLTQRLLEGMQSLSLLQPGERAIIPAATWTVEIQYLNYRYTAQRLRVLNVQKFECMVVMGRHMIDAWQLHEYDT